MARIFLLIALLFSGFSYSGLDILQRIYIDSNGKSGSISIVNKSERILSCILMFDGKTTSFLLLGEQESKEYMFEDVSKGYGFVCNPTPIKV
jgi:hypothetical protein